jgi:large subunit ribosomal protein L24
MKVQKDDKVKIIAGKDKGKEGKVLAVFTSSAKVLVEGVNKVKRHVKPGAVSKEGGIISIEKPISVSNVMIVDPKDSKPTKVGFKLIDGKKYRVGKNSGEVLQKNIK